MSSISLHLVFLIPVHRLTLNPRSLSHRHREVAPGQYEFAPLFGTVTTQIDQNLMVMQVG
jgi:glutamine synthetase type III